MKNILYTTLVLMMTPFAFSQTTLCGGQFYDNGGLTGDYLPNSNSTTIICPDAAGGRVTVSFSLFDVQPYFDGLYVYDGATTDISYLIPSSEPAANVPGGIPGSYWGTFLPGPFTSDTTDGCLTFVFRSDGTGQNPGWVANVSCESLISGFHLNAFIDSNSNGIQDNGEGNFTLGQFHYQVNNDGVLHYSSSSSGYHNVYEDNLSNSYSVGYTIDPLYSSLFSVTVPDYTNMTVGNGLQLVGINFPIVPLSDFRDLDVNIFNNAPPIPGYVRASMISYTNLGNLPIVNGTVAFVKAPEFSIIGTSETVNATPTGFTFDFSNLAAFETRHMSVTSRLATIPTVTLGQFLTSSASVSTPEQEFTLTNNESISTEIIVGAYDPNDITESHGEQVVYSTFAPDDYLTYTIRFENTGTAPASNITITDALDSRIDETSVRTISASANYDMERVGTNLSWKFYNIQLPVSVVNTSTGKGYVTFKAKLKPGFAIGTTIPNMAKIYFDTNPAIDTNTFVTEFVSALSNSNFTFDNYFEIYPNPAKNHLTISTKQAIEITTVSIYTILGQLVLASINQSHEINVSSLNKGTYFIKIVTDKGIASSKFIKG